MTAHAPATPRVLVSVRDAAEARLAAAAGVDLVDLKDPSAGALGALPPDAIAAIVAALRGAGSDRRLNDVAPRATLSATVGDWPLDAPGGQPLDALAVRVGATAAAGVDLVKVGVPAVDGPSTRAAALARLDRLAALDGRLPGGARIVPVLVADRPLDAAVLDAALARAGRWAALMLDTDDKRGGGLLARRGAHELAAFVAAVRALGLPAGLAGALRLADVPALRRLAPDFAGFRGAVCAGARDAPLDAEKLHALLAAMRGDGDGDGDGDGRDAGADASPAAARAHA